MALLARVCCSSVVRASDRWGEGHGLDSCQGSDFFCFFLCSWYDEHCIFPRKWTVCLSINHSYHVKVLFFSGIFWCNQIGFSYTVQQACNASSCLCYGIGQFWKLNIRRYSWDAIHLVLFWFILLGTCIGWLSSKRNVPSYCEHLYKLPCGLGLTLPNHCLL